MKLINAHHYPNGDSSAAVTHLGKIFYGYAVLHPDDKDNMSSFYGCGLAQDRAEIKALKYELKLKRQKCDECRKFVRACENYKNWDKNSPSAKVVYRQLNRRIKEVNDLIDEINNRTKDINILNKRREIVLKAIRTKKSKKTK